MIRLGDLAGARVGLLGFGLEGQASHRALRQAGHTGTITVLSDADMTVPADVQAATGAEALAALAGLDLLIRSPGFAPHHPLRVAADGLGLAQTTATNLFLAELRTAGIPAIGITGSKGKSTTCTLTQRMLTAAGVDAVLVGNIGTPALDLLAEVRARRPVVVMELSSYQCADLADGNGPAVACLLDLFPEHLDWHGGTLPYYAAKFRLAEAQRAGDRLFCNANTLPLLAGQPIASVIEPINTADGLHCADGWFCAGSERLFPDTGMHLPGLHNRRNAVAALALAALHGAQPVHARQVLTDFQGLPFRLQDEGVIGGIRWYNDSIATAPEAVAAALSALGAQVATLICGGYDRGYQFGPIADAAVASAVTTFILLPDTGAAIAPLLRARVPERRIIEVPDLARAVELAREHTPLGRICLFSPGAPSYNAYGSFAERGRHFRALLDG